MSRDMTLLTPYMRRKYVELEEEAAKVGLYFFITRTGSSPIEQATLYMQGRESLDAVNKWRKACKWAPLTEKQNNIVTWTLDSEHVVNLGNLDFFDDHSTAFDIVLCDKDKRNIHWDGKKDVNANEIPDYEEIARIGERIGLDPGARFEDKNGDPRPDYPHMQQPKGITGFEEGTC